MIKSDRWIKTQCAQPPFIILEADGVTETLSHKSRTELQQLLDEGEISGYAMPEVDDIRRLGWQPMIEPFEPGNIRTRPRPAGDLGELLRRKLHDEPTTIEEKILSYGTSSFGYDVTLSDEFRIFTNINTSIIDPLNFDEKCLVEFKGDVCIIPPNSYILGVTREKFNIPRDVMVVCVGKSTYARCGAIVNVTPIEPGFCGPVVIEISNATSLPLKVYADQGIAQFLFFQSDEECETSYADKGGKYQNQTGVTLAKG